jgi:hypothetical protein
MKRYFYSIELLTFVEAKWLITKFVIGGILMGVVILFSVVKLHQSIDDVPGPRPTNTLAAENNFLKQQVNLISPRVNKLEMQTMQLNELDNNLHMLLHRNIVGDTISSLMHAAKEFKPQPLVSAAKVSALDFN